MSAKNIKQCGIRNTFIDWMSQSCKIAKGEMANFFGDFLGINNSAIICRYNLDQAYLILSYELGFIQKLHLIWPSYGQMFLPYLSNFSANCAQSFYGGQEIIVYRLLMRNRWYGDYLSILKFWGHIDIGEKIQIENGRSRNLAPQNPTIISK